MMQGPAQQNANVAFLSTLTSILSPILYKGVGPLRLAVTSPA